MQYNKKIQEFIEKLEKDKKEIAIDLRTIVLKIAPKSKQDIKWGALVFFKGERAFCGIMPYSKYISVIFDRGSEINDSNNILEGSGKKMKHIKIFNMDDIKDKNVKYYIEESFQL